MSFYDNNQTKKDFYSWKALPPEERVPKKQQRTPKERPVKEVPQCPVPAITITGFSNYLVTKDGRVWSQSSHKFLKPSEDANHYLKVSLKNDEGEYKWKTLHILVATAYLPNPNNLPIVNHLNGNKHECNIENLEWDTYSGNTQHAYDTGLITKCKSVTRISLDGTEETTYKSIKDAVTATSNAYRSGINQVCIGKRKTHAGYKWRFNDEQTQDSKS